MSNKFKSGDNVRYINPYDGRIANGVVKIVGIGGLNHSERWFIEWVDGSTNWTSGANLSLVTEGSSSLEINPSVSDVKALKDSLQLEIKQLIESFNEKTNLQIHDVRLNCRTTIGGTYLYEVQVKVDF